MGQSSAETLREIEHARARLEDDLGELGERMPDPGKVKRIMRIVLAGFVMMMLGKVVRRFRHRD